MSESDVRENVLEEFFDLTPERVLEVYSNMCPDGEEHISAGALGEGLKDCGLSGFHSTVPERILQAVRTGSDDRFQRQRSNTPPQFFPRPAAGNGDIELGAEPEQR